VPFFSINKRKVIMKTKRLVKFGAPVLLSVFIVGCAGLPNQSSQQSIPSAASVVAPEPLENSEGKYLSPFTSDEVVAPWVEKGMNAEIGSAVGSYAGQYAMRKIPFVGGMLGDWAGAELGRVAAVEMVGGMDYMKSTTDLSFESLDDLALYTYATHSDHPDYDKVIELVGEIYPEFSQSYRHALLNATVVDPIAQ
jgi:hypothetical protein